jgi:hypothetical protein
MGFFGALAELVNKLIPNRKEAYLQELNRLLVEYQKALNENRDTDAAILRKKMLVIREKLGFTEGDL